MRAARRLKETIYRRTATTTASGRTLLTTLNHAVQLAEKRPRANQEGRGSAERSKVLVEEKPNWHTVVARSPAAQGTIDVNEAVRRGV